MPEKSIWKRDASEVLDPIAMRYVRWVAGNPLVLVALSVAYILEFAAISWLLGRGWAVALFVLSVAAPVLALFRRRAR
jgi:hypothetical protein